MEERTYGTLKYTLPDLSVGPEQRAYFSFPPAKDVKQEKVPLHDYRKSSSLAKGATGLDAHGFTVVNHQSALSDDRWFSETDADEIYLPEVEKLVKELTGARTTFVVNASFRRKEPTEKDDTHYMKADEVYFDMKTLLSEKPKVNGKTLAESPEPARHIHCDYSLRGLQSLIRHGRKDIVQAAEQVVKAEDLASTSGQPYAGPRFAAFSVWRPIKVVRRDPLVVADWRSVEGRDLVTFEYRVPDVDADYLIEAYMIRPGGAARHQWYWLPEQRPDEVFVIKLADSNARNGAVAASAPHASPLMEGSEDKELRESIEVRVVAFW